MVKVNSVRFRNSYAVNSQNAEIFLTPSVMLFCNLTSGIRLACAVLIVIMIIMTF